MYTLMVRRNFSSFSTEFDLLTTETFFSIIDAVDVDLYIYIPFIVHIYWRIFLEE